MKRMLISIYLLVSPFLLLSQESYPTDSIPAFKAENIQFSKRQLIIPGILVTYGIASIESETLQMINTDIRDKVQENIDEKFTIDDFSVFMPALFVYGLKAAGVKGLNKTNDQLMITGVSALLMTTTVLSIKTLTNVERPDESTNNSFPSGHTAVAFAGAEFLYQEYKDVSPWIGVAGYAVATGTGFFRLYNNRHWLSDVMMGAGIGILSTKVAYWTFPYYQIKKNKAPKGYSSLIVPYYNGKQTGVTLVVNFR